MKPITLAVCLVFIAITSYPTQGEGFQLFKGNDNGNTDSRDCKACKKLRFCKGFLGHRAADCEGDDEDEDAEDKWESRTGATCNAEAYKHFVCVRKMDPCDAEGHVIPVCRSACIEGKRTCEKKTNAAAVESCEGLPTEKCWGDQYTFSKCEETCQSLEFCDMYSGKKSLNCSLDWKAKTAMEDLLSSGFRPSRARCPEMFVKSYICHATLRPCNQQDVAPKPCFSDCYRFQHHCLGLSEGAAQKLCSAHSTFYCDSLSEDASSRRGQLSLYSDTSQTSSILVTVVLVFCFFQVCVLHYLRGSAPSLNFLRSRRILP